MELRNKAYKDKNKKKTYGSNINSEILDLFKFSKNPERSVVYYVYAIMSSSSYLDTFEGILYGPSNPEFPPRIPVARDEEKRREIVLLGKKIAELEGPNVTIDTSKNIKLLEDDIPNGFKLKNHKYNPISQTLRLISDNNLKLSVHIPEDIYNLRISGHHVVEKWLRERKFSYYKKEIDKSTMHAFIKVLSSIEKQIIYLKEIDIIVDELITSNDIVICK
ncbi:type ISP restriction/modification enzyme [Vibrio parahaemolyticus]|uniref:type ISP restriction/modification enzyme n=1 Tax=Vibrio parahaemolyticus TaxID=670 RepID=UPI0031FE8F81